MKKTNPGDLPPTDGDVPVFPNIDRVFNDCYRLLEAFDTGGMGRVYKALDEKSSEVSGKEEYVAIKVLLPQLSTDKRAIKRLKHEAILTQKLRHEHIVGVYDFDKEREWTYLRMEWLDGQSLDDLLSDEFDGLPLETIKQYLPSISDALSYAHGKGVIHRDIKPKNIFLTKHNRIVLIDFGISQEARQSLSRLSNSRNNDSSGTIPYMPPEALITGHPAHIKDDIYALAATIYELLTGNIPFIEAVCYNRTAATPLPHKPPQLDELQWQVLSSALAFNPDDRPDSVAKFVNDFCSADHKEKQQQLKQEDEAIRQEQKREETERQANALIEMEFMEFDSNEQKSEARQKIDHYLIHDDGTVTDTRNGLMWQRFSVGEEWTDAGVSGKPKTFTWDEAMIIAEYSDWRLPTIDELASLVYCSSGEPDFYPGRGGCKGDYQEPTVNTIVFPMQKQHYGNRFKVFYWSSSPGAYNNGYAWGVNFYNGGDYYGNRGYSHYVRLVRGGR